MNRYMFSFIFLVICIAVITIANNSIGLSEDILKKKCGLCHMVPNQSKYTKAQWTKDVNRMAKRAGLTEEEKLIIIKLHSGNN